MLLNDREIRVLATKHSMISPFDPSCLNSFGYDLKLSNKFLIPLLDYETVTVIDPMSIEKVTFREYERDYCIIPANSFVLGKSVEYIKMPVNVTGICLGRSTYARCGIITNVTPLEAGWEGTVTIEISNSTPLPVRIHANKGIVQALFLRGSVPERDYVGKGGRYQGQVEVTLPRALQ